MPTLLAGSILPTRSPVLHAGEAAEEPLVIEVFPGADGTGRVVEDDGETTAYREGAVARAELRLWTRAGGRLRLEIGRHEGGFAVAPRTLRVAIRGCPPPETVMLDGERLAGGGGAPGFEAHDGSVQVRFPARREGHTLELEPAP